MTSYFTDGDAGVVCHVDPDGRARIVADDLPPSPNGIVLRPDGEHLRVSLWFSNLIVEYPVIEPGVVGDRRVFVERPSDGMALDADGNLYVTGRAGEITALGAANWFESYPVETRVVSNLVFGGPQLDQVWLSGRFATFGMC